MSKLKQIKERNLKSQRVFDYFEEIASIPHGSGNTKQISDYLVDFAKKKGLEYYQDKSNNVILIKEATKGYETAEPIILQGHMDMVCEKESGCDIDFEREGLSLYVEEDFLKAKGTTLGGDDGIAVAYALALLESTELSHPRLEVVITVDEEIGMLGAASIDLSMLKGHKMLNIDSDEEGHFLTSCAGGMTVETFLPVSWQRREGRSVFIRVSGLAGGHSGMEIDKEHGNANLVMGRVLRHLSDRLEIGIEALAGGLKDNAIPRECEAKLLVPKEQMQECLAGVEELEALLKKEFFSSDPKIRIEAVAGEDHEVEVLSPSCTTKIIFYLRNVPDGVQHMSRALPGLVETSLNTGIMRLTKEGLKVTASVRSSVSSRKEDLRDRLAFLAEFLGGEISVSGDYPAWEYQSDSDLRNTISSVYRELFGKEPIFEAIHAGLECGILSAKIENLDCVSFGPNNYDIHTPKERLSISSTENVWELLVEFLKRCKK
ncbi:MAG: aminoacyl-histidine dipeptidase [Roseburia sp.]